MLFFVASSCSLGCLCQIHRSKHSLSRQQQLSLKVEKCHAGHDYNDPLPCPPSVEPTHRFQKVMLMLLQAIDAYLASASWRIDNHAWAAKHVTAVEDADCACWNEQANYPLSTDGAHEVHLFPLQTRQSPPPPLPILKLMNRTINLMAVCEPRLCTTYRTLRAIMQCFTAELEERLVDYSWRLFT